MLALTDYPHITALRDKAVAARARGDFGRAKALEAQVAKARMRTLQDEVRGRKRRRVRG